jgi:hypothetical protein
MPLAWWLALSSAWSVLRSSRVRVILCTKYPEEPLKEVHESPYRIIYQFSKSEFWVVTVVHFKERLERKRLTRRQSQRRDWG